MRKKMRQIPSFINHSVENNPIRNLFSILRKFKYCVFLILSLSHYAVSGQNAFLDSLRTKIQIEKNDTEKVRMLVQLGNRIRTTDTIDGWKSQNEIERIANATGKEYFLGQAYFLAATLYIDKQPFQAITNYEKAIKIFSKYPANRRATLSLSSAYINLGLIHYRNGDSETAIFYYMKAEENYLKNDPNSNDLAILYSNLSIVYGTINKYDEALIYSRKGLDRARKGKDRINLMNALYAHGGNLVTAKQGTEGLAVLDSSKQMAIEMNQPGIIYSSDFMKAMYYYNTKQYRKAIEYYTNCLEFAKKYNSAPDIGNNFLNIAGNEAELKLARQAAAHLDSSAKYLDFSKPSVSKQMYFENYAEVYKQLGDFTKAFAFKDSVGVIKELLYQEDNIKQLEFRQARYKYEKQQDAINQLEIDTQIQALTIHHKNTLNYFLIGSAITLLIISLLTFRNIKQKQKLQQQRISELETEKQLEAAEAVVKGEEQERTRLAKDLHDGLGGMLSGIKYSFNTMKGNLVMTPENHQAFERSMDMLDSSIREMRRVAHNMMPEALVRFGLDTALNDFCNDINQSGALKINYQSIGLEGVAIDQTVAITLYRIVQELINNTMKHAEATSAIVQITKSNGQLSVTVEDDGKGFDTNMLKTNKGIGWINIQNRVEFLKGKLDIRSAIGEGTSVQIELYF
ncbi:MAG: sensor histidine kinase [Bacteroidales bacterium]|nr:sensor histidine kinase [Bacteroidales bacterium]